MKFKRILAVVLTLTICVSFMPITSATAFATEDTVQAQAQALPDTTYPGTLPSLPSSASESIAQTAINLAWPYGTAESKYKYGTGSARDNFQVAIDKVYPNRSSWGAKPKVGASCDVFVGTVLRYSGYDKDAPRGCDPAFTYYSSHPEKWTDTGISKVSQMQPGDVILWKKPSGTKHTCIFVKIDGVGYIAEAHYNAGKYGCVDKKASDYNTGNYSFFHVYRANQAFTGCIDKGCTGINVQYLQQFLNWAGYDCGTADGSFGSKTYTALKAWQTDAGLSVDGRFGKASLAAAQTFIPSKPSIKNTTQTSVAKSAAPAKVGYSGKWPTLPKKGLKKGSKGTQVKYLQQFLKWYGYSKIKVDGKYGNSTKNYVKKFQKANKIKVDGKFGKQSLKKAQSISK